jgi:hypothetical protein
MGLRAGSTHISHETTLFVLFAKLKFSDIILTFYILESSSHFDARGSSFLDVGRDHHQHYHISLTVCPHCMSSSAIHHRAETPVCKLDDLHYSRANI